MPKLSPSPLTSSPEQFLRANNLRVTRPRMSMLNIIQELHPFHVTARQMQEFLRERGIDRVSLATVYNVLNTLHALGALSEVVDQRGNRWFDSTTEHHFHAYDTETDKLIDITPFALPDALHTSLGKNYAIEKIELIVHVSPVGKPAKANSR